MSRTGWLLAMVLLLTSGLLAQAQPDQAAEMLLNSARKAYNEKNYAFAAARFREFLQKHGNHKDAPSARYGLALALLEGPERDYSGALEPLQALEKNVEFSERPHVLYYLGIAQRGLGVRELSQAAAKPQEAQQRREAANQRFSEAAKQFAAAAAAFNARVKKETTEPTLDLEWSARARCDRAEMELRLQKPKDAREIVAPFLKEPLLGKSQYRRLALYHHGFASFLLQDYQSAGRTLNQLTPFDDPAFGGHARYLLARVHHLSEEHAEAAVHYDGVLADHEKQKAAAIQKLKTPEIKNDPEEKARLESLVKEPPDHVARSAFYSGVLLYEAGKFADAQARFAAFPKVYPSSPLLGGARLREGFCQVQLKDYGNAINTLKDLPSKQPALADQALLWLAKAQLGAADPANKPAYEQALKTGLETLRQAAERAGQATNDPEAKQRRAEILLEMADVQVLAGKPADAAATYEQVLNDKSLPGRREEILQRQVTAWHLAGDYAKSDQAVARFRQEFPKSTLLAVVLFRHAENAYFTALAAEKNTNLPDREKTLAKLFDEAGQRYQAILTQFTEAPQINLARYGLAQVLYRKADYEKAQKAWEKIPASERIGDLALTSYLLADCLIRQAPTKTDDALTAGDAQQKLTAAAELLDAFANTNATHAQTPDALLKLGHCQQRLAGIYGEPMERATALGNGRAAYDRLLKQFPQHALAPQATFERAKCLVVANKGEAINQLRRFTQDPLKNTTVAPLAVLSLATLLREQSKAEEAAKLLADCRQQHEPALLKDPERTGWVALLQYHQGVALREAGKLPEARGLFELAMKQGAVGPEGIEAALRWGQCWQQEGLQKLDAAQKRLATPNLKPEETAAAVKQREEGLKNLRDAVAHFETQAEQWKQKQPTAEARARMHYEAAWGHRYLAEPEVADTRTKLQQERLKKLQDEFTRKHPQKPLPNFGLPELPLSAIPVQPSEQKARAHYQALIAAFADLPLASDARFELAELHAERDDHDPAIKLLHEAIDKEPPPDLTEKIRLRLGACLVAKKDAKAALTQFNLVAQNLKSPLAGQAQYRAAECLIEMGDHTQAAKVLDVFRDKPPFSKSEVADRALLRLGHAQAHLKQWDASRQALELLVATFPKSAWLHEARYGIGSAYQNQKQYDNAVNVYSQVTAGTTAELAARAQLQIGLCRLEQKRYPEAANAFLVVPFTYDYPEVSAAALCEAARTYVEMKQPDQAKKLLQRVLKDHADSKWAEVAKERLKALE